MVLIGGWLSGAAAEPVAVIRDLVTVREAMADVSFAEVVKGATGRRIVPLDPVKDGALLARIGGALDRALAALADADHAAHEERRINEVSRHVEDALREELDRVEGFSCDYPRTADGRTQRSGYPDLRLEAGPERRVIYLDPKLFAADSRNSSLRTFYFTPQTETGKVNEDAHHLLVGIAHHGKEGGRWRFGDWELVDLSKLRVRLKLEFQAGNRDLYRDDNIMLRAGKR